MSLTLAIWRVTWNRHASVPYFLAMNGQSYARVRTHCPSITVCAVGVSTNTVSLGPGDFKMLRQ